jgi:hypothetical protein
VEEGEIDDTEMIRQSNGSETLVNHRSHESWPQRVSLTAVNPSLGASGKASCFSRSAKHIPVNSLACKVATDGKLASDITNIPHAQPLWAALRPSGTDASALILDRVIDPD